MDLRIYDVIAGPKARSWVVDEIEAYDRASAVRKFRERRMRKRYPADARLVNVDDEDPGPPRGLLRSKGARARVAGYPPPARQRVTGQLSLGKAYRDRRRKRRARRSRR